ncbi:MAG: ABC transporter substrate-binding protein [Clostridiaceae bacterium]|nr:ABC transporter substrate-binding protein [Clostridiaceae bacterium]
MKKAFISVILSAVIFTGILSGCATKSSNTEANTQATQSAQKAEETPIPTTEATLAPVVPETVTITDSDGNEVTVKTNPTRIAIYDYSILDILYNVGFENTRIEKLIVPAKENLPDELAFYKNAGDELVISGGSLFYIDWDVLDLIQPDLVIIGGRAFGMGPSGERLSSEDAAKYREDTFARYPNTTFVKLTTNATNSQLTKDIENNINALAQIFPELKDELEAKLTKLRTDITEINKKAKASGKKALFAMMVDQTTLSVFNPNSRFDMIYEEFGFIPADEGAVSWTNQHGFDVRAEYVLEKNPDVIFLLDRSATVGSGAGAENFMNDPIIKQTTAAQNGDIYVLSGNAWYTMTGGISATETMIADLNQYIIKLN